MHDPSPIPLEDGVALWGSRVIDSRRPPRNIGLPAVQPPYGEDFVTTVPEPHGWFRDEYSYSVVTAPDDLTVDRATGELTWRPGLLDAGVSRTVTVRALNTRAGTRGTREEVTVRLCRPIALALAFAGSDLYAHHAIGHVYDSTQQITIEGTVTGFRFTNPHPLLFTEVATESGRTQSWRLEMDNRFELARIGMSSETFQAGDRVVARGSAGRTPPQSIHLRRLDRSADGLRYEQRGSTPHLALGTRSSR